MAKKIVMSFDDGRIDFYTVVFPLLKKYNVKATLNVVTGFSDGTYASKYAVCNIDQILEMHKSGLVEIAIHGDAHLRNETVEDFEIAYRKLISILNIQTFGVAMPYNQRPTKQIKKWAKNNCIQYIRIGWIEAKRKILLLISKLFHLHISFKKRAMLSIEYNSKQIEKKCPIFYSIPIEISRSPEEYLGIIESSKNNSKIVLMFHSIYKSVETDGNIEYSSGAWSSKNFEILLASILKKQNCKFAFQKDLRE